jgi:hypothetical protein
MRNRRLYAWLHPKVFLLLSSVGQNGADFDQVALLTPIVICERQRSNLGPLSARWVEICFVAQSAPRNDSANLIGIG